MQMAECACCVVCGVSRSHVIEIHSLAFFFASALRIFSRPEGYDAFTLHRPYSKGLIEIDDMGERHRTSHRTN